MEQKWKAERVAAWLSLLAGVAAMFSGVFGIIVGTRQKTELSAAVRSAELERTLASLNSKVADLQQQLQASKQLVDKLNNTQPANAQIASLSAQLGSVQNEIKMLEDAVGQSPDKALAVPLLRKDVDNLREAYHRDFDNTQAEVTRVYDQNKWFIGLMFTMALGLLGLAVSNFLQLRKS